MGAWGYGPFENDAALDFVSRLVSEDVINELISIKNPDSYNYEEARVTAKILIHLHKINKLWVRGETLDGLEGLLNVALNDKAYSKTWDDGGRAVKRSLKILINQIKKLEGY